MLTDALRELARRLDDSDDVVPAAAIQHHPEFSRATLQHGELVTLAEAARRLGKPESTLRRWLSDRRFRVLAHLDRTALVGWGDVVEAEFQIRNPKRRGARPPRLDTE